MKNRSLGFLVALLALTMAISCGESGSDVPDEILVGGTLPKVGKFAPAAAPFDNLAAAWADEINAQGGVYLSRYDKKIPVRFIFENDQSDPDICREHYEKLVTENKVDLLIGPYSSTLNIQAQLVAQKHEIPLIIPEGNSGFLFSQGNEWSFGVLESGEYWSHRFFDLLKAENQAQNPNNQAQTVAFVGEEKSHTTEVFNGAVAYAEANGFTNVYQQMVDVGESPNFTTEINAIVAIDPDVVFVSSYEGSGADFVEQAKALGLAPKAFHTIHHGKATFLDIGNDANGITGDVYWAPSMDETNFTNVALFETIQAVSEVAAEDYPEAAIRMFAFDGIKAVLEEAGSVDPVALRDAFRTVEYESIGGTINFDDATGEGTMGPYPSQYQDGNLVLLWPSDIAEGNYIYPRNE